MDKFIINGGGKLSGSVRISGAKNAILPIMTATLLAEGRSVLENVPHLNDIKMMAHLLRIIGARVDFNEDILEIDSTHCSFREAPYELVSKMRASIYVLGPLLARFGDAKVSFPGGCAIGTRPVDLHLRAMEALGAEIRIEHGYISAQSSGLKGNIIDFRISSVGATANALMAAVLARGRSVIKNAALEPEIASLIDFLVSMGARISGMNTRELVVDGVSRLTPTTMKMIPDRIETGTYLAAAVITGSNIIVENCCPDHLAAPLKVLNEVGCSLDIGKDKIKITCPEKIKPALIRTLPYPEFPTDLQAQFTAMLTLAEGESRIEENIFPDRFMHVAELNRLDADIAVNKNTAVIHGVTKLSGAPVMATDLRASAALVLAGLAAKGETEISRIYHIDRGYDRIEQKLQQLGANIKRIKG